MIELPNRVLELLHFTVRRLFFGVPNTRRNPWCTVCDDQKAQVHSNFSFRKVLMSVPCLPASAEPDECGNRVESSNCQ